MIISRKDAKKRKGGGVLIGLHREEVQTKPLPKDGKEIPLRLFTSLREQNLKLTHYFLL